MALTIRNDGLGLFWIDYPNVMKNCKNAGSLVIPSEVCAYHLCYDLITLFIVWKSTKKITIRCIYSYKTISICTNNSKLVRVNFDDTEMV